MYYKDTLAQTSFLLYYGDTPFHLLYRVVLHIKKFSLRYTTQISLQN